MATSKRHPAAAFTLIELLVVIAVIALLIGILLPALGKSRKAGRTTLCMSNMRTYGTALANYATDWKNLTAGFSWRPGVSSSSFADLNGAGNYVQAHAYQAVDIVRRRTGRTTDGYYGPITDRMMNRNFGHLPLVDGGYFSEKIPEPTTACPEDRMTLTWQKYPNDYAQGLQETGDPDPASSVEFKKLSPFWSTYQAVPNAWSPDGQAGLYQASGGAGYHLLYYYGNSRFGNRSISDVFFPSQKVWLFDLFDRHMYRRTIWHSYDVAAQPLLFFDGSVNIKKTRDANRGWNQSAPASQFPTQYQYWPTSFEPRTLSGAASENVFGYFRWTRAGLKGVDFGGGEQRRW